MQVSIKSVSLRPGREMEQSSSPAELVLLLYRRLQVL
jgi:hypothetical protein